MTFVFLFMHTQKIHKNIFFYYFVLKFKQVNQINYPNIPLLKELIYIRIKKKNKKKNGILNVSSFFLFFCFYKIQKPGNYPSILTPIQNKICSLNSGVTIFSRLIINTIRPPV